MYGALITMTYEVLRSISYELRSIIFVSVFLLVRGMYVPGL